MADTYPQSLIPEPYQRMVRSELRKIPVWKLQEVYGKLKAGESTGIELMERNRAYAISAVQEILWERGKLPTRGSHSSGEALIEDEWERAFHRAVPLMGVGLGAVSLVIGVMTLSRSLGKRVYYEDGNYLVSVRYPGQWYDLREFIQPDNPEVIAVYSQIGPAPWSLFNWVCENISYRRDVGELWQFPSETLRGYGDCEDSAILLTSLFRAGGISNCCVALGVLGGYGHAWCQLDGQILETTYTHARLVPNPRDYKVLVAFNEYDVCEAYSGALEDLFLIRRDEPAKLNLIAQALGV